jgi:YD repeat-containing protein
MGGGLVSHVDPDGVEHVYVLDGDGRLATHEVGGVMQAGFDYDDYGNPLWLYDARGYVWYEEYDDRNNRVRWVDPLGHETALAYDLNDRLVEEQYRIKDDPTSIPNIPPQPPLDVAIKHDYDRQGNRVRTNVTAGSGSGALSRAWEWHYDANERLLLARSPRAVSGDRVDAQVRYEYNARNLVSAVTTGHGGSNPGTTSTCYDAGDNPAFVRDPRNNTSTAVFDGLGRLSTATLPNGLKVHNEYLGPTPDRRRSGSPHSMRC